MKDMGFTDGKPWRVTEEDCKRPWSGKTDGTYFRCYLCGHEFKSGDIARWQFMGNFAMVNLMICESCDGTPGELASKWQAMREESENRMWWFCREG